MNQQNIKGIFMYKQRKYEEGGRSAMKKNNLLNALHGEQVSKNKITSSKLKM